jgi:hypothetical protein
MTFLSIVVAFLARGIAPLVPPLCGQGDVAVLNRAVSDLKESAARKSAARPFIFGASVISAEAGIAGMMKPTDQA